MTENITERTIVRDLVVKYPPMRIVLEKLGIDYCCGGEHTLREAALVLALTGIADEACPGWPR